MKVICDRGVLAESLSLIGSVVLPRTPKPVLLCVKVTAEEGSLTLTATDQEVAARLSTPRVEVEQPGEALIPADKFQQIVRESIDPTLTIETEQDVAHITGQDSKYKIFGQAAEEFPPVPEFDGEADFRITAGELHRLIAMTLFATARENSRYATNGVLLERSGTDVSLAATDGHRLAFARGSCEGGGDGSASGDGPGEGDAGGGAGKPAIVPTKALNLLLKLFDDAQQIVHVRAREGENQILFATDQALVATNLVEGNFPPYRDVIPRDGDKKATLATDTFTSAVRRAALLTNEESKGVRMSFSDEGLTLTSRAPEMGEAEIRVEVPEYQGEPIAIGFNPGYLLDALKVVDEGQVQLEFKAANKPGVLKTGPNFLYVVMPVNLQ